MRKKCKGYMTVEASFIVPIVLIILVLIVKSSFFLYDRCVMSQDGYLLAFRGSSFTLGDKDYGEIIYGDMALKEPDISYAKSRMYERQQFYPFFGEGRMAVYFESNRLNLESSGFNNLLQVKKQAERKNPLLTIRKEQMKHDYD